jgi:hypothetical protein
MEQQEDDSTPSKDKENTTENEIPEGPSSVPSKAHYDAVKMKYFASLGMNKPPLDISKRDRSTTAPVLKYPELTTDLSAVDKQYIRKPSSPARKRSVSTPLNSTKGIPIPGSGRVSDGMHAAIFQFDDDDDDTPQTENNVEDNASYRPGQVLAYPRYVHHFS